MTKKTIRSKQQNLDEGLLWAVENDNKDLVKILLKEGANVDCFAYRAYDDMYINSVGLCAEDNNISMMELLLQNGATLNFDNDNGRITHPLVIAVLSHNLEMTKYLLVKECSANQVYKGNKTILSLAIDRSNDSLSEEDENRDIYLQISQLLLDHGAKLTFCDNEANNDAV
jgi:ankyrin repeat protein